MTEPTNGLAPENEAGKFDEHVAATIRTAVDEWRTGNNPADVHGVSMPECIRRSLADAGLLAPYHRTHSLCLEWDDTCEGFAIVSDGAEAGQVVVLADTVRQVMRERDLALALQRAGFRSMKDQVDAMARKIGEQDQQLALAMDTLGSIWLYVKWRYVTGKLTTEQRELWADAVDAFGEPQDGKAERWWRDDFVEGGRG